MNEMGVLVVDVQKKLLSHIQDSDLLEQSLVFFLEGCRLLDLPIFFTEQYPKGLGSTIAAINPQKILQKETFSLMRTPETKQVIDSSGISHWWVCGIETHICVQLSVEDLIMAEKKVTVVRDGCGARSQARHLSGLSGIHRAGAAIEESETLLYRQFEKMTHPKFSELIQLVKKRG